MVCIRKYLHIWCPVNREYVLTCYGWLGNWWSEVWLTNQLFCNIIKYFFFHYDIRICFTLTFKKNVPLKNIKMNFILKTKNMLIISESPRGQIMEKIWDGRKHFNDFAFVCKKFAFPWETGKLFSPKNCFICSHSLRS